MAARTPDPPRRPPRARPRSKSYGSSHGLRVTARPPPVIQQTDDANYEFVTTVTDKMTCDYCKKTLCNPHLTICCRQHFCETCLNSWSAKYGKEKCPKCRAEGENYRHALDHKLAREIESLQIFCPHKSKGCDWRGEMASLKQHLEPASGCRFEEVECPNRCSIRKLERAAMNNHLQKECEMRPSRCPFCGHKDVYKAFKMDGGHYSVCPEYQWECPNNCGAKNLKHKDKQHHKKVCPNESIKCPFEEAGCKAKLTRRDLEQHMGNKQQQHLLMVMGAYRDMKEELQKASSELQEYKSRDAATRHALVLDLKLVRSSAGKEQRNLALALIQTQLGDAKLNWLKRREDRLAFRMLNFRRHKATGQVWHSPAFFYKEGYKMCIAVYPSDLRSQQSHVTLFLLLIRGEFDSDLKWPIQSNFELKVAIIEQQAAPCSEEQPPSSPSAKVKFCSKCTNLEAFDRPTEAEEKREVTSLGSFKIQDNIEVVEDSIVISVRVTMHQH